MPWRAETGKKPGNEDEKNVDPSPSRPVVTCVFVGIAPFSFVRGCQTNCCRFKVNSILLVYANF